jgi:hypothetical protein
MLAHVYLGNVLSPVIGPADFLLTLALQRVPDFAQQYRSGEWFGQISGVRFNPGDSNASLHVVYAGSPLPTAPVTRPSDLMQAHYQLEHVIGDGPKESGGVRRDVIATQAVLTTVQQIGRDLVSQLAVSYVGPPGKNGQRNLSVSTSRRGVKITAPTRTFSRR